MNDEKIIDRIKKLLAMSKDTSSPNEAAIAAKRARKLMDDYQITELELTTVTDDQFGTETYSEGTRTISTPLSVMAVAIATYNDCHAGIGRRGDSKYIKFNGLLVDAVCAGEMFKYLRNEMYRQAERNAEGRADRFAYRRGFASGIALQVKEAMLERQQLRTSTGTALVVCKQQLVTEHFGRPRYANVKSRFSGDAAAYRSGVERGYTTSLNRQVGGTNRQSLPQGG